MFRCKLAVGLLSGKYSQQPELVPMETGSDDQPKQKVVVHIHVDHVTSVARSNQELHHTCLRLLWGVVIMSLVAHGNKMLKNFIFT